MDDETRAMLENIIENLEGAEKLSREPLLFQLQVTRALLKGLLQKTPTS
jgi:hypothetical protein